MTEDERVSVESSAVIPEVDRGLVLGLLVQEGGGAPVRHGEGRRPTPQYLVGALPALPKLFVLKIWKKVS